jgi:hypothetical protein
MSTEQSTTNTEEIDVLEDDEFEEFEQESMYLLFYAIITLTHKRICRLEHKRGRSRRRQGMGRRLG